jgi:hypothetical protein
VYVYVHEIGTLRKIHTHFVIHLPPPLRREFESMIPAWLDSEPCRGFIEVKPVTNMEGLLGYLLRELTLRWRRNSGYCCRLGRG